MEMRTTKNGEAIISGSPEELCKFVELTQQFTNQQILKMLTKGNFDKNKKEK